ncbi:hypothetical protein EYC84_002660 [Monilinia fructicola]|uniref:DUF7871 domain-containing protein n=1 Tax=Monilinia fructicola TaxID=38448 RepID=A0A5M9JRB7_MONFR|nr:hypothetical protein EYC84_002660 [Monilinia fructicola]
MLRKLSKLSQARPSHRPLSVRAIRYNYFDFSNGNAQNLFPPSSLVLHPSNVHLHSHSPSNAKTEIENLFIIQNGPSTCCGRKAESGNGNEEAKGCVCASQAKCSCGQQKALECTCGKAESENEVKGARCSCRARAAGSCTCSRASEENRVPSGELCGCGARPVDACTCEKAADGGLLPTETDFTTRV